MIAALVVYCILMSVAIHRQCGTRTMYINTLTMPACSIVVGGLLCTASGAREEGIVFLGVSIGVAFFGAVGMLLSSLAIEYVRKRCS
jgi:hypothetical protein